MKKQMKLCTLLTKPFVLFVLLFALGVGNVWGDPAEGDNWYDASGAEVYFDNTNSVYSNVSLLIGRKTKYNDLGENGNEGSDGENMTLIENTNNLYHRSVTFQKYTTMCFVNATNWGWGSEKVTVRMGYVTSTTTSNDNLGSSTHLYVPASADNNCAVTHTTPSDYDGLNYTQTVQQALTTDGGSTYAASTLSLATVKVSSYYLSAASTASATGDKIIAAGQSSNSCKAARTATVTYTVSDVQDGYEFLGWFDGSTKKSTATTYDYQATEAKTITARFAPKFTIETLYLVTNANWRGSNARFAAVFCNRTTQQWEDCSVVDGTSDEIYTVDVPEGDWSFVIFCRMNPTRTGDNNGNNWNNANRWNQTSDMVAYGNSNCVYITGDGSNNQRWGKYAPSLALVGTMNNWDPVANPFTDNELEINTLAAHSCYNFKIANGKDDAWFGFSNADNKLAYVGQSSAVELNSNDHNILLLTAGTGNYTFTWDATEHTLAVAYPEVTHPSVDYVYVKPYSDWNPVEVLLTGGTMSMVAGAGSNLNSFEFNDNDYYYAAYGDNTTVVFGDGPNGPLDGHKTDALTISGNEGKYYYAAGEYKDWQWLTFQVGIGLNDLSADTRVDPNYFFVQLNSTDLSSEAVITTLPEKENYEFEGFCVNSDGSGTEIIDKDGHWNTSVAGYTDATPKWIHEGTETTLYAKWTEILHDVDVEVSPAGAGSVQVNSSNVSSVTGVGIATKSDEMTPIALAGWKFKEWQVTSNVQMDLVNYHSDYQPGTANKMKINATADDQTITAVFEPRFELVGSTYANSEVKGGMPGWSYDGTGVFEVLSTSPVNLTCTCSLEANTTYKFEIRDRAVSKNYGDGTDGIYELIDGNTAHCFNENMDMKFQTTGAAKYVFQINEIDGSDHPYVKLLWPRQVNFGWNSNYEWRIVFACP